MAQALEVEPGQVFTSPSKTLTDAHFLFFAGLTGDNHPIHYDVEYAKSTRFGAPLAHGLLLAAMTESLFRDTVISLLSVERGRFLAPVRAGDTIRTEPRPKCCPSGKRAIRKEAS